MMPLIRSHVRWSAPAGLALLLAACSSAPAAISSGSGGGASASSTTVRLGTNATSVDSTVVSLTQSAGIFSKDGAKVDIQGMNGSAAVNALIAGEIDGVAHSGTQLVLSAMANGAPLKIVAVVSHVYNVILTAPNSITSLDQLRGKKVGAPSGTSVNAAGARHALQNIGLVAGKDYELIETGTNGGLAGAMSALVSHQIDAAAIDDQFSRKAIEQGGYHALLDLASPEANVSTASQTLVFRADFVQQHPDAVQKTVDGLMDGIHYLRDHKAETQALLKSRSQIDDPGQLDETYQRQVQLLAKAPSPSKDQFTDIIATMPKGGPTISDAQLSSFIDAHFVEDAVKRGLANY